MTIDIYNKAQITCENLLPSQYSTKPKLTYFSYLKCVFPLWLKKNNKHIQLAYM